MKKIIVLLIMIVFPVLASAQLENEPQQPEIKFDIETYDMGVVTQGKVSHSFGFKNVGMSELVIERLVPS